MDVEKEINELKSQVGILLLMFHQLKNEVENLKKDNR